jgi:DNA-binding transcriptional LysR family regulator
MVELLTGLSLDRLKTFCMVVRAGSITAAAADDPNRQSQFSRQIKDLEEAIGKQLVKKEGKSLKPTAAGLELAALAGAFFAGLDDLRTEADAKPITLAGGESIIRWVVVPGISRLTNPTFQWNLKSMRTKQTLEALLNGTTDLGVVREDAVTEDFVQKPVGAIEYIWVFPRRLLPGRTSSGIYDAKRLPFAFLAGDGKLAQQIIEAAAKNQIRLDIRMQLESFSLLLEAVKTRNLGALVPQKAVGELPQDEFAVIEDEQLAIPPRPLALVAHAKTYNLRPRLRNAFEECARILA